MLWMNNSKHGQFTCCFLFIQKLPCVSALVPDSDSATIFNSKTLNLRNIEEQKQSKSYCLGSFGVINQKNVWALYVVLAQFQFSLFAIDVHMGPK